MEIKDCEENTTLCQIKLKKYLNLMGKLHDGLNEKQRKILSDIYAASYEWKIAESEASYSEGYADGYADGAYETPDFDDED